MSETVVNQEQGNVLDDAALNPVQDETETLSQLSEITEETQQEAPQQAEQPAQKEPGYIRQRVDKAVQKALQEQETRLRAEFDAVLAPIRESVYERQAEVLVASGEFKTKERALEYVKLKNGVNVSAAPEQPTEPQRDAQGRFAPKPQPTEDATTQARAELLARQAEKIKANRGLDVMSVFNGNPDIQQKILSGEWDFYDVAESMAQPGRRTPSPIRNPNGASIGAMTIQNMSDAQFQKLQENLAAGKIYDAR